jgi:hypothetical protein
MGATARAEPATAARASSRRREMRPSSPDITLSKSQSIRWSRGRT